MENNIVYYNVAYDDGAYSNIPYLLFREELQALEAIALLNALDIKVRFYLSKQTPLIKDKDQEQSFNDFINLSIKRLDDLKNGGMNE